MVGFIDAGLVPKGIFAPVGVLPQYITLVTGLGLTFLNQSLYLGGRVAEDKPWLYLRLTPGAEVFKTLGIVPLRAPLNPFSIDVGFLTLPLPSWPKPVTLLPTDFEPLL